MGAWRDRPRQANPRRTALTRRKNNPNSTREKSLAQIVKEDVAAKIALAGKRRKAESQQRIPKDLVRPVRSKETRDELRKHGFRTTKSGVVIDGPRNNKREKIPGSKIEVLRGGVVKTSVGRRRDFIYGFTKSEKKAFAEDTGAFIKKKTAELRKKYPLLKHSRNLQIRLQWGAYQATKNFSPNYFTKEYLLKFMTKAGQIDKTHRKIDALTGIHIVVHVPRAKKK